MLIFINYIFAKDIEISNLNSNKDILVDSYIYIDKNKTLEIDEVLKNKSIKFTEIDKSVLSYGYSPDFDVWIKFTLKNISNKTINKILEYDNPLTSNIVFYSPDLKYKGLVEGILNISEDRKTLNPIFKIKLDSKESKTFYLKASSKITTLIIKLNLWDIDRFYNKESSHKLYLGLFFGSMFILLFYNFFIFVFTRDISYFYYICYVLGLGVHHFLYVGFSNLYFIGNLLEVMRFSPIIIAFPIVALALFTYSFIKVEQYKIWCFILKSLILIVTISSLLITYLDLQHLRNIFTMLLMIYLFILTIYAVFRKNKQAYFILFGWTVIFLAVLFMILSSSGIFNIFESFPYVVEVAITLEATIFSIALAYRINTLRKKEKELTHKIIEQKNSENKRLEQKIEIKTKDLQIALDEKNLLLKELNHRVKNNMQMIASLIRLQSRDTSNKNLEDILLTIQNRINAMGQLHDMFYKQDNILSIDSFDYISLIVNELSYTYDKDENVDINFDIKSNIKTEDLMYCGLIVNELVTNCFKYAFKDKKGLISIKLLEKDNLYTLEIKDNGIGFLDDSLNKNSLGLILVKSLVKEQLKGDIIFSSNNGCIVEINWRKNV